MADPFIAEIRLVGFNFAPRGWAFCDGQMLPIPQHTALFSLVGTVYGGNGRTTFGIPDFRNRLAIHEGTDPKTNLNAKLGSKGGATAPDGDTGPATLGINYVIALTGIFPSRS